MDIKKEEPEEPTVAESRLARKRASGAPNSSNRGAKRSSMMGSGGENVKEEILEDDVKVEVEGSDGVPTRKSAGLLNVAEICYTPRSPNVQQISAQVKNEPLEATVKFEVPDPTNSTMPETSIAPEKAAPCRVFLINSFQSSESKPPTKESIRRQIVASGAPPIPLEHLKTFDDHPMSVGKKYPRILAVKFEILSDGWLGVMNEYMETNEYKKKLEHFYRRDEPVITRSSDRMTLGKIRMAVEVGKLIKVESLVDFVHQTISGDFFEEMCHQYERKSMSVFHQMSCMFRKEIIKAADAFKQPFNFGY